MRFSTRTAVVAAFAALAFTAAVWAGFAGWFLPDRSIELTALVAAALLTAALAVQHAAAKYWSIMPPSFIVEMTALLLLGPEAMIAVAATAALMLALTDTDRAQRIRRSAINIVSVLLASLAAGWLHRTLGGTLGWFVWPQQGLPIAAAVAGYCLTKSVLFDLIAPFAATRTINRSWPRELLLGTPIYVIGAALAVGLTAMITARALELVPIVIVPLVFAYLAYSKHVSRAEDDQYRREVIESVHHGMAVVDADGIVTLWSDELAHLLDCPAGDAVGQTIGGALRSLDKSDLPKAINDVLTNGNSQTIEQLKCAGRTLQVRILPTAAGATLLFDDVAAFGGSDAATRRVLERLALAAEGANDGLWEWDLRSGEFYSSSRWRAMLGLTGGPTVGAVSDWFGRVHNEDRAQLKAALESHLAGTVEQFEHTHRIRHEDGSYRRVMCRSVAKRGTGTRQVRIAGSLTDVTEASATEVAVSTASLDPLTGIGNRSMFVELLGKRLDDFKHGRASGPFAVLYLDLDRFKVVNDHLGHMVGDELLTEVSRRLQSCLRKGDVLARLGGDEFAILLNALGDTNRANAIAFRLQAALNAPVSIGGREVFTSASIGIACGPGEYTNPEEILRDADVAMYHAKSHGKARHEMFDADMHARELDRVGLENDLRHAVNNNDFELHYQPIVLLQSRRCVGFESLARWTRKGEPVSPAVFIPLAEELGIVDQLGNWALREACLTFADWKRRFPDSGLDYITVNVSSRQLMQKNFIWIVERAVEESGLKPSDLRLEITETALMDNPGEAAKLLSALREFGAKIYLDDFGCGYSSLSHLAKLPVDALKIDRSFVKNLSMPDRPAIVESILALAHTLHTGVVAEGIEQESQGRELERLGCTHAQGFLFSKPLSAKHAEEIIAANKPLGPAVTPETMAAGSATPQRSGFDLRSATFQWPEEMLTRPRA
jgi:diguanylate cyclase (GGDEF)-like protein/PAS domain S-box-containing protein